MCARFEVHVDLSQGFAQRGMFGMNILHANQSESMLSNGLKRSEKNDFEMNWTEIDSASVMALCLINCT